MTSGFALIEQTAAKIKATRSVAGSLPGRPNPLRRSVNQPAAKMVNKLTK
jgi:hypothetical protein